MASFRTRCSQGLAPLVQPDGATLEYATVDINWADAGAGIALNDVIQIADIPPAVEIVDWKVLTEDIDSNGVPTVAFTLGYLNAAKTAIGAGAFDAFTAAGAINAGQTGGANAPAGATAANCLIAGRGTQRTLGLVATAATATAALAAKRASVVIGMRSGQY